MRSLTNKPGVYLMFDEVGKVIYVGKAKNLKKRVSSYFGSKSHHPKITALISKMRCIDVTITGNENEALLLEYNLIKQHQPYFNVLLRDDKSYPYIFISSQDKYPRLAFHRGARRSEGRFIGPFPNPSAVRQSLTEVQKLFRVRQCDDSFFTNRTRPCLQHQIKRCSAPCVGLINEVDYQEDVKNALFCLTGRSDAVLRNLSSRMDKASNAQKYELAARLRDQIGSLQNMQNSQNVTVGRYHNTDVLAAESIEGKWCVSLMMVRGGRVIGNRNYFPQVKGGGLADEIIESFLMQHYFESEAPKEIIVNEAPQSLALISQTLTTAKGVSPSIRSNVRGLRKGWLAMAATNAKEALQMRQKDQATFSRQYAELIKTLTLKDAPQRIECFDISHTSGEKAVASCVVFGPHGSIKSDYRRYNINDVAPGDDYAAIAQVINRRYTKALKNDSLVPDLIIIDGGKGQLNAAKTELECIQLTHPLLMSIAKGSNRKPGQETLYIGSIDNQIILPPDSIALHFLQQIRDEAHRFAIAGHRYQRGKVRKKSGLERIPGVGKKRRRYLLRHFGGLQGVQKAGVNDLIQVEGISENLAKLIYDQLQNP
ncbi:MAG: excinuclease ABC subunit UvrC [Pseudomonadota bacterium]|nr:excinuclease ABC subunit UvrC [Pseudomonadota bacterium]